MQDRAAGGSGRDVGTLVAVGLGSNLGDRVGQLRRGRAALAELLSDLRCSRVYETDPVGREDQRDFLNLCCVGRTDAGARSLLQALLAAERRAGRRRGGGDGPRRLDLDLLLYGHRRIREPGLEVPHPRMAGRGFVLVPLAELVPGREVPGTGATVGALAEAVGREGVRALGRLEELREGCDGGR